MLLPAWQEKGEVCVEVYRTLSKPDGGDPEASLSDVVARVSRAFGKPMRDVLLASHSFILQQLAELDAAAGQGDQILSGLAALK